MSTLLVLSLQEKALKQTKFTKGKIVVVGQKIDLVFHALELGLFSMDFELISKGIDKAKKYVSLKVYEGLYCMPT